VRGQRLLFVDIYGKNVHLFSPQGGEHLCFSTSAVVGAVVVCQDDSLLLACHDRFVRCDSRGERQIQVGDFRLDGERVRFNDGKVDPWGRFVVGSMDWEQSIPLGQLYMLWPDTSVTTVFDQVTVSNGLAWSADGKTLYYIDTPKHCVERCDVDGESGQLSGRRRAFEVADGAPDGMAIDDEGCLWVALWDGGRVQRYTPEGQLLGVVRLPDGGRVSSIAFGGQDMSTLYITTAHTDLSEQELASAGHAGDLFAFQAPVTGPAPIRFGAAARN
jgi:sugar lactone lactonase YvrE